MVVVLRCSVVRFIKDSATKVFVSGSLVELGEWNPEKAVELETLTDFGEAEPKFFEKKLSISDSTLASVAGFQYKFLCRTVDPNGVETIEWEGKGPEFNREFIFADHGITGNGSTPTMVTLRPSYWHPSQGPATNERQHTLYFYLNVIVRQRRLHTSRLRDNLRLGSCPRRIEHLDELSEMGVTAVVNLQTGDDLLKNSADVVLPERVVGTEGRLHDMIQEEYKKRKMVLVWLPAEDMTMEGRKRVLPHAAFLIQSLLLADHSVYVHCNAGVGRAAAAVCGYLHYVEGIPLDDVHHTVAQQRPIVYFDRPALEGAYDDFRRKFGVASDMLKHA